MNFYLISPPKECDGFDIQNIHILFTSLKNHSKNSIYKLTQFFILWYMINWHRKILEKLMVKLNLDAYQVAWIAFFKGILISVILYLIFIK